MDLLRIIIAILLPPLGVFMQVGFGGAFWLNILLTLCGYIPGIVHAFCVISRRGSRSLFRRLFTVHWRKTVAERSQCRQVNA